MNTTAHLPQALQDRYGLAVAARLSDSAQALPHDLSERLRAARVRAVAARKPAPALQTATAARVQSRGATLALGGWPGFTGLLRGLAGLLPVVVLAVGLVAIKQYQDEKISHEVAAVDTALLLDDLPPAAYADPGFQQYLRMTGAIEGH